MQSFIIIIPFAHMLVKFGQVSESSHVNPVINNAPAREKETEREGERERERERDREIDIYIYRERESLRCHIAIFSNPSGVYKALLQPESISSGVSHPVYTPSCFFYFAC